MVEVVADGLQRDPKQKFHHLLLLIAGGKELLNGLLFRIAAFSDKFFHQADESVELGVWNGCTVAEIGDASDRVAWYLVLALEVELRRECQPKSASPQATTSLYMEALPRVRNFSRFALASDEARNTLLDRFRRNLLNLSTGMPSLRIL